MSAALKRFDEYQPSAVRWVDDIPTHWRSRRIKTFLREVDQRSGTGEGALLTMRRASGLAPLSDFSDKITEPERLRHYKVASPGQIVMNPMQAGNGMFAVCHTPGLISPDYRAFELTDEADARYLIALFKSEAMRATFRAESKGLGTGTAGFLRLYPDRFGRLFAPFPPPEEQRRIADFLDAYAAQVHRLIAAKRRTIAILDEQRDQATEAVLARHGIADATEMMLKRALDAIVGGSTPSPNPAFWDGDIIWVTPPDISASDRLTGSRRTLTAAGLQNCAASIVPAGTVILTSRAPVGNIAIADVPVATNQGCKALVPNLEKVSTEFLALTARRLVPLMKVLSTGTTFQEISTGRLGAIKINVPTLPQQTRMLDAVKAEVAPLLGAKQRVLSEIDLILEYRDSLIAAAVTGRIDVRDAAIPVVEGDIFADDTATDADDLEDALDAVD